MGIPCSEMIIRLVLSAILGGLIGVEREKASWFAGLRTHMLVCIGSALIMMVSQHGFQDVLQKELIVLDPSRVAAQVVSGMGFLGAGTILFWKNKIRGLTTAASLWTVAGVGLAVGGGLYIAALATTGLALIVLAIVKPIKKIFFKKEPIQDLKFSVKPEISLEKLEEVLTQLNIRKDLKSLQIKSEEDSEQVYLVFSYNAEINLIKLGDEIKKISRSAKVEILD